MTGIHQALTSSGSGPKTLQEIINAMGATSSLNFCLDAGDTASYSGTGQTWTDTSGSGNSFFRGDTGSASATDPTFNTSGSRLDGTTTYWSFDGGDYFQASGSPTFAEPWHKAGATYSLMFLYYLPTPLAANTNGLFATRQGLSTNAGIGMYISNASAVVAFYRSISNSSVDTLFSVTNPVTANSYNFIAITHTDGGGPRTCVNGVFETLTPTSSTSTEASTSPYQIGNFTDSSSGPMQTNARLVCTAGWSRQLSDAEVTVLYNQMKLRVLTLP
jgi:hypothetical protein